MSDFAKESGHWYDKDGNPRYTITGKNGKERATTVRDAREHGLMPSVTTICSVIAKPGLENWKIDQAVMAALTGTRRDGESDSDYIARIKREAQEQAWKAAEFGTTIHGQIERHYRGEAVDPAYRLFVDGVVEEVNRHFPDYGWQAERSFSWNGYGGKVDLHGILFTPEGKKCVVIDFKGKDGDLAEVKAFDEHRMQLAAYASGLFHDTPWENVTGANCFFSRTHPGVAKMVVHSPEELTAGLDQFLCAKALWSAMKGYRP